MGRVAVLVIASVAAGVLPPPAEAQAPGWTATLVVQPFPSPFLADWERNPQMAILNLIYSGTAPQDFRVEGFVRSAERGELARVASPPIAFGFGPVTQLFTSADILDWETVSRDQVYTDQVLRTGMIPEGRHQMCARVLDAQNVELVLTCADFTIALPEPPQLIFPANTGTVAGLLPVFQWTPIFLPPEIGAMYRLRLFELLKGQTPETATLANPVWFEVEAAAPLAIYPLDALPLDPMKEYVWQVEALDGEGRPVTRGGRSSEIWTFAVGGPGRELAETKELPDTLTLIPGVARLTGLRSAQVDRTDFAYVVNGWINLELDAPAPAQVRVEARDLEIDQASILTLPVVRSGDIRGSIKAGGGLDDAAGPLVRFTEIGYGASTGLTLAADLMLPGAEAMTLSGRVQVTASGLFGTLRAEGTDGRPLLALGNDPVQLTVRRAQLTLPGGNLALDGDLQLFARDVGCDGVQMGVTADGALTATVACSPNQVLPLVGDAARAQIALRSIGGAVTVGLTDRALSYAISASGDFRLDAGLGGGVGANCGAGIALTLKDGDVSVPSFTPRCDANEGESDMGWLRTKLSSLTLNRFAYTPGQGFDFELLVDLAPWLPAIEGLELPRLTQVTVTQNGFSIPAVDVKLARPPFTLGGFGLKVTRVQLPAFTLTWSDWQVGSANGFRFAVDAELTLPEFPGEGGTCLNARPIRITGAEIANGKFRATLEEQRFTPACGITLFAPEASRTDDTTSGSGTVGTSGGTGSGTTCGSGPGVAGMMATAECLTRQTILASLPADWQERSGCQSVEALVDAQIAWSQLPGNVFQTYTTVKCPGPSLPEDWANPYAEPESWSAPPLQVADRWPSDPKQAEVLYRQDVERIRRAQAALDSALSRERWACDDECKVRLDSARLEFAKVEKAVLWSWDERDFGEAQRRIAECLGRERQKQLLGIVDDSESTERFECAEPEATEIMNRIKARMGQPPDCRIEVPYLIRAELGIERQRQLLGAVDEEAESMEGLATGLNDCGPRALAEMITVCQDPNAGPLLVQDRVATVLGIERQKQLLGAVDDEAGSPEWSAVMDCAARLETRSASQPTIGAVDGGSRRDVALVGTGPAGDGPAWWAADLARAAGPSADDGWTGGVVPDAPGRELETPPRSLARLLTAQPPRAPPPDAGRGGVRLEIERFGGELVIGFSPFFMIERVPEIDGNVVLPPLFTCADSTRERQPLLTKLRLGPRGEINGTITGFVPTCPLDLAAVRVQVTSASLTFSTASGNQSAVLSASATATFTLTTTPVIGQGSIAVDLLRGRILAGSLAFQGPFRLDLPREQPVFSFQVQTASLDSAGVHIDGRAELTLADAPAVSVTFDRVTIDPRTVALTRGQVLFDLPFAFEVGIGIDGALAWRATARGAALGVSTGLRVDLPSRIALGPQGFSASGDGGARLVFEGRDVDSLTARFTGDFALGTNPPRVVSGMVDFQRAGVSLAYVDALGFHPNLAYFATAVLPARLPLPVESVAYLELRDANNTLRVSSENVGNGIRLFTPSGVTIPLVVPALQLGRATPPQVNVGFDLTLDPLGQGIKAGAITVALAPADRAAFDLSELGLPLVIDTLAYDREPNGAYRMALGGSLALFGQAPTAPPPTKVLLTLDGNGTLAGAVNVPIQQSVALVEGSTKLTLALASASGAFNANLPTGQLQYRLDVAADLELETGPGEWYRAGATLEVSDLGVKTTNVRYAAAEGQDTTRFLDLEAFRLGLRNLRVPLLVWDPVTGFRFELLFDAVLNFPTLSNLTLPPIRDISLRNDGFTIPAWEIPELTLDTATFGATDLEVSFVEDTLRFGGLVLKPLAFRMSEISYNWFTGQGPANWGFGFDVEFRLANLGSEAPAGLRNVSLRLLNAGLQNGQLYGSLERVTFPQPLDLGIGDLYAIWGQIPARLEPPALGPSPADTAAVLRVEANLDLAAALPVCDATIQSTTDTLALYADGWVAGRITGVVPACDASLGPFQFAFGNSELVLGGDWVDGARQRRVELAVDGQVTLPAVSGGTVTAQGNVRFDVLNGTLLDGRIAIDRPFRWTPPDGNPYLAFDVSSAVLDTAGLRFTGGGQLRLGDGATVGVTFNDFVLGLPDFAPKSGSVTITSQFALGVGIDPQGQLQWGAYSLATPRPAGSSFRLVLPQTVTIDATGLTLTGTASASLVFADQEFAALDVAFTDGFAIGFTPVAVRAGRADFVRNGETIAYLDPRGFWPGNVFAAFTLPDRVGLPAQSVAYVELRDAAGNLVVESSGSAEGIRIQTRAGSAARLVVPALATEGGQAPAADVEFDLVVNSTTFQPVSGFVRASAPANRPSLFSLRDRGVPLEVRSVSFEATGASAGLRLAARVQLPASLAAVDLVIPDLAVTAQGLTGTAELGTYADTYDPQRQAVRTVALGPDVSLEVTGARVTFGTGADVRLSGALKSRLFAGEGDAPAPLFFTGRVSTVDGLALTVDPGKQPSAVLPLAVATFEPQSLSSQPAFQITASETDFTVRLSGTLRVPSLSPTLALTLEGLEVGTAGVRVPTMSFSASDGPPSFGLFGASFVLRDSTVGGTVVYPALAGSYAQGNLTLTLSGDVEVFNATARFAGLTISTAGDVSLAAASVTNGPLEIVPNVLTLEQLALAFSGGSERRFEIAAAGRITLPAPGSGTIAAQGNVRADLVSGRILDGRIDVTQPFRWQPPGGGTFLTFTVSQAHLDATGLHFTGGGQLRLADGATVGVAFNDLVVGLPDFVPTSGSATFTSQFALGVGLSAEGQLAWGAYGLDAPRPSGNSFRATLPQTVTLDATGLTLGGTASASLRFADQDFATLDVSFVDGFAIGFAPVKVTAGRANFVMNGEQVAYVDAGGFWPGNLFAALPVPARLGLPGQDVAYLELRDGQNVLLVETATTSAGLQLRTRAGSTVRLVVPALAASEGQPPSVDVAFDVVVQPTTFQLVSGSIRLTAPSGQSLFGLRDRGLPLDVQTLAYERVGDAYGLRLDARLQLPASIAAADLVFQNLVVTSLGLTGTAELGTYADTYDPQVQPVRSVALGPNLTLDVTGVRATLGDTPSFRLAGALTSPLFAPPAGAPAPLPYNAQVTTDSFTLTVDPDQLAAPALPIAVATFQPQSLAGQPAFQVTASASEFRLRLSGTIRVPTLSPGFAVTLDGLEVGTAGVRIPAVSITEPQEFTLFGAALRLRDSTVGGNVVQPAVSGSYTQNGLALTLNGELTVFGNTSRFTGLTISADGNVQLAEANLLSRPVALIPDMLTADQLGLAISGTGEARRIELSARARVALPAPSGDSVVAQGSVRLDLANGRLQDGAVELTRTFRWQPAGDNPYLRFDVDRARLDSAGLRFTGGGRLRLADGATVSVTFNDLLFRLPDFALKAGSATITNQFVLGVGIGDEGGFSWGAYALNAPRPAGTSFRVALPQNVTIDTAGVRLAGTASASLRFGDRDFPTLQVLFADSFAIGFTPLEVTGGRADFVLGADTVARVDAGGFWPGNVFAILPVPERLGLPTESVAYLELKDSTGAVLVESSSEGGNLRLRTRSNTSVRLVIPALASQDSGVPSAAISFDVVVNPVTYQFVSGFVRAEAAAGNDALFSLAGLGIPLTVRRVAFEPVGQTYGLRVVARLVLPPSLDSITVDVPDLTVTPDGLSGVVRLGSYIEGADRPEQPLARQSFLGDSLVVRLDGVHLTFGANPSFAISGSLSTFLFRKPNEGPAILFWSGDVSPSGVTLQLDDALNAPKLPLAVAFFEPQAIGTEPAFRITATAQEFTVRMSGVVTMPSLSPTFALSVAGLQIGTSGVSLASSSISGLNETQSLQLFGATFTLQDSMVGTQVAFPAVAMTVEQGVIGVSLSGTVAFMGNTSRFAGLQVRTDGQVSLASANLLSQPLAIVENVLALEKLSVTNNRLRADLSITLPEPLSNAGPQQAFFEVGADGQIAGGASLALVQEAVGLNPQSRMQFNVGVATVHLRYLGLDLDFAALRQNSAVKVVTDVYLQNNADNRIQLGDVVGNVVQPGLRVGFDGSVAWGNLALVREFDFDFEAVRLRLTNVSLPQQATGFAIGFGGRLSLGLAAVSGSLGFRDFVITSRGDVQFNAAGVEGGELGIADVVTLSVAGFEYSATPTSVEVKSGGMPSAGQAATSGTQTIDVASYVRFGGSISVAEVFSGDVQEFLLYRTPDQMSHLIVREASLAIQNVITMRADFRYDQSSTGFEMLMGAQGQLFNTYGVMLVGAIAQEQQLTRVGIFLAAQGLTIPVPGVPIITITGLGGGFFLNPKAEYLDLVRQYAGVSQSAGRKIAAPAGDFAVMLYGAASIVAPELIEGRILLTIMNTAIQIDGAVAVLNQGNRFAGDAHLVIGLQQAYAEGNINLQVNYSGIIEGGGTLDFFVYSADNWGVYGTTNVTIVAFLQGSSTLFVGPPGFVVKASIKGGYNIWVVAIEGFVEGTVWYKTAGNEWGAFVKVGVEASILGGVASAKGTLMGALIFAQTPLIFAAAELQVQALGIPWTGIVWVKWENGQPSAGFGSDPAMEAAIAYAGNIADEMMAAKDEAQSAIEDARAVVPDAVALTDAELARAYATIQGWSPGAWGYAWFIIAGSEYVAAPQPGEGTYQSWYNDLLRRVGMPGDSGLVAQYTDIVDNAFRAIEAERPVVQSRIAALQLGLQPLAPSVTPTIPGSPLRDTSFAAPVTTERLNADGLTEKVLVSGPRFDVDVGAAQAARLALGQVQTQAAALDQQVRERIAALESGLATVRAATTASGTGSLVAFAKYYADVGAAAERQFAAQADLLLQRQDWARLRLGDLAARDTTVTRWVQNKTNALRTTGSTQAFNTLRTLTSQRVKALATFSGNTQLQAQFAIDSTNVMASSDMNLRWNYFTQQANTAGRQLWYEMARAGMDALSASVDQEFPQLGTLADTRLATVRTAHTELSQSLAGMYEAQAAATGALYDLYDRYLFWRTGETGSPTTTTTLLLRSTIARSATATPLAASDLLDVGVLRSRKTALAQDLTVPRLNGVSVTATSTSQYAAQLQFTWSAWHPSGAYEFQFRDVSGADQALGAGFLSNGPSGALNSYRFTANRSTANSQTRTFQAGVRGGAGFTGYGRANYTVSFLAGPTAPVSVSGTGLLTDATAPSNPVVTFPGHTPRINASFQAEIWTSDPNEIAVEWSATDVESGVSEYQYALWSSSSGTEIRAFTTAGGRTGVTLDRLGLASGQVVYVAVRARNGQGLMSGTGVSAAIRYDPTPPAFPAGATIQSGGSTLPMRSGGTLTLIGSSSIPTFPACPIPAARSRRAGSNTTTAAAPAASFTLPYAADSESGVLGYQWRVSAQPESVYTASGWTAVPAHPGLAVSGAPLNHQDQFYLSVVALNFAGTPSRPVTTGPFRISDPTAPASPTYCAAVAGTNDRLNVLMSAWSGDPETAVQGYRYRVRTAAGAVARDWPASGVDWQPPASFADDWRATAPLTLAGGQSYYVDVRAVNGQGMLSEIVSSGPVLYDITPPPTPSATVSYSVIRLNVPPQIIFQVSAPNDPESGLTILQYAVGTTQGATDVIGWNALPGFTVGSFTTSVAAPPLARGTTFWIQIRTRNGVGTWSAVYPISVRVP